MKKKDLKSGDILINMRDIKPAGIFSIKEKIMRRFSSTDISSIEMILDQNYGYITCVGCCGKIRSVSIQDWVKLNNDPYIRIYRWSETPKSISTILKSRIGGECKKYSPKWHNLLFGIKPNMSPFRFVGEVLGIPNPHRLKDTNIILTLDDIGAETIFSGRSKELL
jgi:hypothetical protein